jgi:ELWxxDGT repeat protein
MKLMKKTLLFVAALSAIGLARAQMPQIVKDIAPGASDSWPYSGQVFFNNKIIFTASDQSTGYEPYISDGTVAGTTILKDINPSGSSTPHQGVMYNGMYYFTANDGTNGREIWVTDGTTAGTNMFLDLKVGPGSVTISTMLEFNNKLYFTADTSGNGFALWATDGTVGGTQVVADVNIAGYYGMVVLNNQLIFPAQDTNTGSVNGDFEVWASDGTTSGTHMLRDIFVGADGCYPQHLTKMGNKVYFSAVRPQDGGSELWATDGTTAGTDLVKDIATGSSQPSGLFAHGNNLYFSANVDTSGVELWTSDGTAAGTVILANILPGTSSSSPDRFAAYNNKVYFRATDSVHGKELWVTDGTTAGTTMVKDFNPGTANGIEAPLSAIYQGRMYLYAIDPLYGMEVWHSDGTDTGTHLLYDINPGPGHCLQDWGGMVVVNNILFFGSGNDTLGAELYKLEIANTSVVEKLKATDVVIYPNPATNELNIRNMNGADAIRILDMAGRTVSVTRTSADKITMNISTLTNGIYMVQILNKGAVLETRKLTITK